MPLPPLVLDAGLDSETFLREAKNLVRERCPGWTDLSPSDPGTTLLEAFAYIGEMLGYRINRIPEKAYVEFLRLWGITLRPPAAAKVRLRVERLPGAEVVLLPRGTRIKAKPTAADIERPEFVLTEDWELLEDGDVVAYGCEAVGPEVLTETFSGEAGQRLSLQRPPVIAPTHPELEERGQSLRIAVECGPDDPPPTDPSRELSIDGVRYRLWREVASFAMSLDGDCEVYVADRMEGTIEFAPLLWQPRADTAGGAVAPIAHVPARGRRIVAWYLRGGGSETNVGAWKVGELADPVPGVKRVQNHVPATGGAPAETLENARIRGPRDLRIRDRIVSARDFEETALSAAGGAAVHACVVTKAARWRHAAAKPGVVQVFLVPSPAAAGLEPGDFPDAAPQTARAYRALTAALKETPTRVGRHLEARTTLGVSCEVRWAPAKPVSVAAIVRVDASKKVTEALKPEIRSRLYAQLEAYFDPARWPFGRAVRTVDLTQRLQHELGGEPYGCDVSVTLKLDEGLDGTQIARIAPDPFHPGVWYAATDTRFLRSENDAVDWDNLTPPHAAPAGVPGHLIAVSQETPGLVASVVRKPMKTTASEALWEVWISRDAGESWDFVHAATSGTAVGRLEVTAVAWLPQTHPPQLWIGTNAGLFALPVDGTRARPPDRIDVGAQPTAAVVALATGLVESGAPVVAVAVAASDGGGVFLKRGNEAAVSEVTALKGCAATALALDESTSSLWVAFAPTPASPRRGCARVSLAVEDALRLDAFVAGFPEQDGRCSGLVVARSSVYAATNYGLLVLDAGATSNRWRPLSADSGLPLRKMPVFGGDPEKVPPKAPGALAQLQMFASVESVAVGASGAVVAVVREDLTSGPTQRDELALYRRDRAGERFERRTGARLRGAIGLPSYGVACSGKHEVEVVSHAAD